MVSTALRRPFTILVAILGVLLTSVFALREMDKDVFPSLGVPTIYVAQPYGGMDPAQMEGFLTYYYEYHFLYITGIEHIESKSIQGAAVIKLQFYPTTDMSQAMGEVVAYVNRARAFMPPGTVPPFITRFDAGSVPVGNLVFTSETKTVAQIQDLALNTVRPLFATLPGVSAPPPFGGSARTIVITASPERMQANSVSADDIVSAVAQSNLISPSGNINLDGQYPIVPVNSVVRDIGDLQHVPIRGSGGAVLHLSDLAEIKDASDLKTSVALANGRPTVYIPVTKRADASTLTVVESVKANLPKFQAALPDDVKVSYQFDQSYFVTQSISSLALEGALGALLSGLMVLFFLRDWRSALIVVINIPVALMSAAVALWLTGATINLMTLGGLALAVGILVDMSTVAIENIHSQMSRGASAARASLNSAREVGGPLFVAMLCVLGVFVPSFLMEGVAKALFAPLALAVGFAMVASYILAFTLVPILSVWFLKRQAHKAEDPEHRPAGARFYARITGGAVRLPLLVALAYVLVAGAAIALVAPRLGIAIFPAGDTGEIQVRFRAAAGTNLDKTVEYAQHLREIVEREAGAGHVEQSLGLVGVHAPNYPINLIYLWNSGPHEGVLQFALDKSAGIKLPEFRERLRQKLAAELPELQVSFEPSDIVSRVMSFGASTPISVEVSGADLKNDREFAEKVRQELVKLPYLRDVQFDETLDYPAVSVAFDRERGGEFGITTGDVVRSLAPLTSSSRFTQPIYWAAPGSGISYQIQVQVPSLSQTSVDDINNLPVGPKGAQSTLLRNVASVEQTKVVGQYDRYNSQRTVRVTANIESIDLGAAAAGVRDAIKRAGDVPARTTVTLRGQAEPLDKLLGNLSVGLGAAVVMILLILIANFQSPTLGLLTLSTVPAVIAGVVLMLWITNTSLNLQSFMGAIMALGVAVANAIVLIAFAERSRLSGLSVQDAAVDGATSRLRPILMTSFAMMAGMLPMALGLGEGGDQTAPLGRAVLGGLLGGTIATLLVLPALFALTRGRATRRQVSLHPDDIEQADGVSP